MGWGEEGGGGERERERERACARTRSHTERIGDVGERNRNARFNCEE